MLIIPFHCQVTSLSWFGRRVRSWASVSPRARMVVSSLSPITILGATWLANLWPTCPDLSERSCGAAPRGPLRGLRRESWDSTCDFLSLSHQTNCSKFRRFSTDTHASTLLFFLYFSSWVAISNGHFKFTQMGRFSENCKFSELNLWFRLLFYCDKWNFS